MTCKYFILLLLSAGFLEAGEESGYVPKPKSPERQSICDAARDYVVRKHATSPTTPPIVFKIERIRVQDDYCNFEAVPLLKDGSYASPKYMPDIVFNLCLQKSGQTWSVITDLSRTDVPDAAELATIKKNFPSDFPKSLLSSTWRDLLSKAP